MSKPAKKTKPKVRIFNAAGIYYHFTPHGKTGYNVYKRSKSGARKVGWVSKLKSGKFRAHPAAKSRKSQDFETRRGAALYLLKPSAFVAKKRTVKKSAAKKPKTARKNPRRPRPKKTPEEQKFIALKKLEEAEYEYAYKRGLGQRVSIRKTDAAFARARRVAPPADVFYHRDKGIREGADAAERKRFTSQKNPTTVASSVVLSRLARALKAAKYPGVKTLKHKAQGGRVISTLEFGVWKVDAKGTPRRSRKVATVIRDSALGYTVIDAAGTGVMIRSKSSIDAKVRDVIAQIKSKGYMPSKATAKPAKPKPVKAKKNPSKEKNELTALQKKAIAGLSADAKRLWNDLVNYPRYHGGLATDKGKRDLKKAKLVTVLHHASDSTKDVVTLTAKGKAIAKKLRAKAKKNPCSKKNPCTRNPKKAKQPTKKQIATLAAEFRAIRAKAAKTVPALMATKLVLDASVHDSARHFAMTKKLKGGGCTVHVAPELALEPKSVRVGVLRHEMAHCAVSLGHGTKLGGKLRSQSYDAKERRTDRVAEKLFGGKIYYDKRGVETTSRGTRPRPAGLR
jgi:hypothetical protein